MANKAYKVWVEIEEWVDGEPQDGEHVVLPDPVGFFEGPKALEGAMDRVAEIVEQYGQDPENSDCVRHG